MKKGDLYYFGGLILGMVIGNQLMAALGVEGLFRLLGALAVGVAVGFAAEHVIGGEPRPDRPGGKRD